MAQAQESCKAGKCKYFNTICRTTSSQNVWRMIKKMRGIKKGCSYVIVKQRDLIAVCHPEKDAIMVKIFVQINHSLICHRNGNIAETRKGRLILILLMDPYLGTS